MTIISYYLKMDRRDDLRVTVTDSSLNVQQIQSTVSELSRHLYHAVGEQWSWHNRMTWSQAQWETFLTRPTLQSWVVYVDDAPVGYFELEKHSDQSVELAYFGLLPQFIGKGLGGGLLTAAVTRAWDFGATHIWLHTCSTDHPHALPNYLARGFQIHKEECKSSTASVILLE